jgi:hypothetical protein
VLFFAAGACLIAHFAFCAILQQRLRGRDDAFREFFAIPNEPLIRGGNVEIRLLRARYYLPWTRSKAELDAMDRTILAAAQLTGFQSQ